MNTTRPFSTPLTAIVSGGAGALGSEIALELSRRGYRVALADKDISRGEDIAQRIRNDGRHATFHALDVTEPSSWIALRDTLQREWSQLDMFVSAAGILTVGDFERTPLARHAEVVSVNLLGTIHGCHTLTPWLKAHRSGSHMVLVASCAGFLTMPWSSSYNASKAGVLALGETLAAEFFSLPVRVTTACPAFFPSGLFEKAQIDDPALARLASKLVRNSKLTPQGVALRICEAALKGEPYVVMPRRTYWLWRFKRLLPALCTRRIGRDAHRHRANADAAIARSDRAE
jgi:NAD(P)-dependent dehydrogenase (short-subunit alcohol dehydrogenase family)